MHALLLEFYHRISAMVSVPARGRPKQNFISTVFNILFFSCKYLEQNIQVNTSENKRKESIQNRKKDAKGK